MNITVTCSRCGEKTEGIEFDDEGMNVTGGFYRVTKGYWKKYADKNEDVICDNCMHVDVRYIKDYGYIAKPRKI